MLGLYVALGVEKMEHLIEQTLCLANLTKVFFHSEFPFCWVLFGIKGLGLGVGKILGRMQIEKFISEVYEDEP